MWQSFVCTSVRAISDYKQLLASEMEREATNPLFDKNKNSKAIIYFDTTGCSFIDGEWPSTILSFSDGLEYRFRSLFFAYEDRQQITDLFFETFSCLSMALNVSTDENIEPVRLREKVDAIMTDAVTKNLGIEETVLTTLGSSHQPYHLLCKSHTVEALDRSNLEVLSKTEKSVKQQDVLEQINPPMKTFFRGKKALIEAGIEALLSLITLGTSGKSSSQADLFDHICEKEQIHRRVFLYQQRRVVILGKAALCIRQAKDILQMLIIEVEGTNQLVESCRIYLSSELFIT